MTNVLNILGESGRVLEYLGALEPAEIFTRLVFIAGVGILLCWLFRGGGFSSLKGTPARLNKMRLHTPLLQLFIWIVLVMLSGMLIRQQYEDPNGIQGQFALYVGLLAVELGMICSILVVAFMNFHGRFSGFGLNLKTLPNDIRWGAVNYLAAMPIVMFCVWGVVEIGKYYTGSEFALPKNESLKLLLELDPGFRIIVILSAGLVVPVFEELLFRGLIQSSLRSHLHSPWFAILLTSMIFVVMHGLWLHWLPLMGLSICMGYAYEKSGSILRPICVHVIFNCVTIAGTMIGSN